MNQYMKVAKDLSEENILTNAGGPFGACIVKNNQIIGRGKNQVIKDNDPTAHAEVMAIRDACKHLNSYDLEGCELYTTCYPCPMCLSAIIWANIKKVYYGNTKEDARIIGFRDEYIYEYIKNIEGFSQNNQILRLESLDRSETIETFKEYLAKKDKPMY